MTMEPEQLAHALLEEEQTIEEVLRFGILPDWLLHMFASDCAERAIWRSRKLGRSFPSLYSHAVSLKRRWLLGRIEADKMVEAQEKVRELPFRNNFALYTVVFYTCSDTIDGASVWSLIYNSLRATPSSLKFRERQWCRDRLIWLLETYQWAGERMLFLVPQRKLITPAACAIKTPFRDTD